MLTKHFFKILIIFAGMIIVGLIGIFLVSYFEQGNTATGVINKIPNNKTPVAK